MIRAVTQRPRARLDLLEQFVYLGENGSVEVAERYFAAVEETCSLLLTQPQIGALYESGIEKLSGLRRVAVKGFAKYWLFYLPGTQGIDVIRVLHGARDIESIFSSEEA